MMKKTLLILALASSPAAAEVCCVASWYKAGHHTASGEKFVPGGLSAAHKSLPLGSRLKVRHKGRSIIVRVNDRVGPAVRTRVLDLSQGAARKLGISGLGHVCFEKI